MSNFCGMVIAGVGAAATIAGSAIQSGGASDAAATSAGQSQINAAALRAAGQQGDKLLAGSGAKADTILTKTGKKADRLLTEGYKGAVRDMRPYDRLGLQGSNALANYLGFVTAYTAPKPQKPPKGSSPKAIRKYEKAMAEWQTKKTAFYGKQKGKDSFGEYFDPYTKDDLMADPVYQTELDENVRAWDQSAASRGSLMSGNTVAGLRELTAAGIQRGYDRDWNQDERKYNAFAGLNNMGLGVRTGLAQARMNTAGQRANTGVAVGANRASTGVQVGTNRANTLLDAAGSQAQYAQNAANTQGAGQVGQGNAYGNAFNNIATLG